MATVKELKAELKAKGIKGITGKKKAELEAMLAGGGGEKAEKKLKAPYVKKLTKDPKTGKLMKMPTEPVIDKQISVPKEKVKMNLQEELAKAGLRGGMKKKYKV